MSDEELHWITFKTLKIFNSMTFRNDDIITSQNIPLHGPVPVDGERNVDNIAISKKKKVESHGSIFQLVTKFTDRILLQTGQLPLSVGSASSLPMASRQV